MGFQRHRLPGLHADVPKSHTTSRLLEILIFQLEKAGERERRSRGGLALREDGEEDQ